MARAQRHKRKLGDSANLSFVDDLVSALRRDVEEVPEGFVTVKELAKRSGRNADSVRGIVERLVANKEVESKKLRINTPNGVRTVLHIKPLKKISLP